MQDFNLESVSTGVEHIQMVKATPVGRNYSSKDGSLEELGAAIEAVLSRLRRL